MAWTSCLVWRATSGCGESSASRCGKPGSNGSGQASRRACLRTSRIAPESGTREDGTTSTEKGPRPNTLMARRIRVLWSPRCRLSNGRHSRCEDLYCARGDMENRIKEQFSLFADRVSAETMRANQLRLYLSAMAYLLVSALRRLGLKSTELAQAQVSTIRTKLLKIGAQVRVTVRKVWVSMASSYPWQDLYQQVCMNLRC